jgi:DNA invertase Pin-like site-specific DNA recombinase
VKGELVNRYCALYIRVSTTDQGERYSPASQERRLREKAAAEGCIVREEWIFRDQMSGKTTARPGFERLRELVKTGAVAAVFVFSVDRLARKLMDAAIIAAEFKRHGATLDFAEMKTDDSPEGRFMFNQYASMAEYLGEKIIENGKRGRREKLEQGFLPHGSAKYGYNFLGKKQGRRGELEINENEAAVVREVFRWRKAGMATYAIAAKLNEEGILSKGHNGQPPRPWSRTTVLQMLKSSTYIGQHKCSGMVVAVPRIIDDATFHAVQAAMRESCNRWIGRPSKQHLLRSFVWCGCQHRLVAIRYGSRVEAYRCGHRTNKPPIRYLCATPRFESRRSKRRSGRRSGAC